MHLQKKKINEKFKIDAESLVEEFSIMNTLHLSLLHISIIVNTVEDFDFPLFLRGSFLNYFLLCSQINRYNSEIPVNGISLILFTRRLRHGPIGDSINKRTQ